MQSLADIETIILVNADAIPGGKVGRTALVKIAQDAGKALTEIPASEALGRLEALRGTMLPPAFYVGRKAVVTALNVKPLPQDVIDRIRRREPTLEDAALAVDAQPWGPDCGRVKSALKRAAKRLGREMDQIPAIASYLEPRMAEWMPLDFGIDNRRTFDNLLAYIRRAIRLVDVGARRELLYSQLTGPWRELIAPIKSRKDDPRKGYLAGIWPLVRFCHERSIQPASVDDAVIAAYREAAERAGMVNPFHAARVIIYNWQKLQKLDRTFPQQVIARIYQPGRGTLDRDRFCKLPVAFQDSWKRYEAKHYRKSRVAKSRATVEAGGNSLAERLRLRLTQPAVAARKLRSPKMIAPHKSVAGHAVEAATGLGIDVQRLEDILTVEVLIAMIGAFHERQRKIDPQTPEKNNSLFNYAYTLVGFALDLRLPEAVLGEMRLVADGVDPNLIKIEERDDGTSSACARA